MKDTVEEKLRELGLELPLCPTPVGAYVPAVQVAGFVYASGQTPVVDGKLVCRGKVGEEITVEEAYDAARICALRCLAEVKSVVGSLDRVKRIVKVTGFVNSGPGFAHQPKVINGASELLEFIFGERGKHARVAIGVANLPDNAAVEVELIAYVG